MKLSNLNITLTICAFTGIISLTLGFTLWYNLNINPTIQNILTYGKYHNYTIPLLILGIALIIIAIALEQKRK